MKSDYTYCLIEDCSRSSECKRNLSNYTNEEVKKMYTDNIFISEIQEDFECKDNNFNLMDKYDN